MPNARGEVARRAAGRLAGSGRGPQRTSSGPMATVVPAIAVMTFSNITREPADDWIGMGIAETVTADLKKVRGIAVIGRTQVFDAIKHLSDASLAAHGGVARRSTSAAGWARRGSSAAAISGSGR